MAFTEAELAQHQQTLNAFLERRRPPVEIRHQVDLAFRITNQSIEIFEIRPVFNDPQRKIEIPIAKTKWVKSAKVWRLYWQPADMKWHLYNPLPEVSILQEFLDAVDADTHGCFFG